MLNAKEVLTNFGATVVRLVEGEDAGRDGFYIRPQYHSAVNRNG